MISVHEAKAIISAHLIKGKTTLLPLEDTIGLTLAEDIPSLYDIPNFDNSSMDGYAIKWEPGNPWRKLRPETKIRAGDMDSFILGENEAIRIFTGAPVPKEADTVIPQESVQIDGDNLTFEIAKFKKGVNFRSKGAQNKAGDLIAIKGAEISPGMIGLLSSIGLHQIPVYLPPSVGIILTGDELEEVGTPLTFGKVYDANGPVLRSYCQQLGVKELHLGRVNDEPENVKKIISNFLNRFDMLLISGGISVGDYDFVKAGLESAGVKELFYKIRQKPGKPLYIGRRENQWVFALPGNPASTLTCFNQYVKPCIQAWVGKEKVFEPTGIFPIAGEFKKKAGLTFFLKAKLEDGQVHILPGQESFDLISYGTANCIAEVDEETAFLESGTPLNIYGW